MFKPDMFDLRQSWCSDCWPLQYPRLFARQRPRQPARPARTMLSGSVAARFRMWRKPRHASQRTGAASVRYAGPPSRAVPMCAAIAAGMVEDRGKTRGSLVARMERSAIRGRPTPDHAALIRATSRNRIETAPARETFRRGVSVARDAVCARDHGTRVGFGRFSVAAADRPRVGLRTAARSSQPRPPGCSGR
jgi:hypothetical protein